MKLTDLTPSERRQITTGRAITSARGASPSLGVKRASPNGPPSRQGDAPRERTPIWGCHDCPATFTTLASAERHTGPGHRRLDWLPCRGFHRGLPYPAPAPTTHDFTVPEKRTGPLKVAVHRPRACRMTTPIPTLLQQRDPDLTGLCGSAWDVSTCARQTPDQNATVASWIVQLPASHPIWPTYLFGAIHLRDMPGQSRPPSRDYPEAEYEFLVVALNPKRLPGHPLSSADVQSWQPLIPVNIVVHFDHDRGDEATAELLRDVVQRALDGHMGVEPDDDGRVRPYWRQLVRDTADHYRGAHE